MKIDLFVEDRAHEEFLKPLVSRVAMEENVIANIRVRCARGGHSRAIKEYILYQYVAGRGGIIDGTPDILIVAIDGNCTTAARKRAEIENVTETAFREKLVTACPDPHIERWYLADPTSFNKVVGFHPEVTRTKCVRDHYKHLLTSAIRAGEHPIMLGGVDFAPELVGEMDFYDAGKNAPSLGAFVSDLRAKIRQITQITTNQKPRR
jgi:hypothetical protein